MIPLDKDTKVVVQGITGRQGRFHTLSMLDYGTNIVCGVTPGKKGEDVHGIPVYDSIAEADEAPEAAIIFVPAKFAKQAIMEAIEANLNPIVAIPEHIPVHDAMECVYKAQEKGISIVGPNTPGLITVGKAKLGIMPNHIFKKGSVGVVSRSGTLTYEVVQQLSSNDLGQSTVLGLGGDPVTGIDFIKVLEFFENDPDTEKIVLLGEIGGSSEENAAAYIKDNITKKCVSYVAGSSAPEGKTMGHAGAIISGNSGTYESKKKAFEDAGVALAKLPKDIVKLI